MKILPILMYHSISSHASPGFQKFILSPEQFDAHLAYLAQNHYTPLTVAQLVDLLERPADLPEKPVVLTFDDGFADFHGAALPLLQKYAFPASLYIVTGFMENTSRWLAPEGEQDRPMLKWSQLAELCAAGVEIGAHTHTHADLDLLEPQAAREEMLRSKDLLEQHTGQPVTTLAYPYGHFDATVRRLAVEIGFRGACAVKRALSHTGDDRFALARLEITSTTNVARLESLLSGRGVPLASPRDSLVQIGWRSFRRFRKRYG